MSNLQSCFVVSALLVQCVSAGTLCFGQTNKLVNPEDLPKVAAQARPAAPAKKKPEPKVTISKETTWFTEPLGPSGKINYMAAVNQHYSKGVTPENNSVVLLYRALGPAPEKGKRQPDEFFKLLGMEPLPDEGPYFEELADWWKRKGKELPPGKFTDINQLAGEAQSRPWTAKEFPDVAEWLAEMEEPLARVVEATERTEYYSPLVSSNGDPEGQLIAVLLPGVQKARSLARTLQTRAMLRLGNQDSSLQAWSDLITLHRLGRLVGRGPTLIEGLVGIAIESMSIDVQLKFISETHPSANFVRRYRKQLQSLPPRSLMVDKIGICERAMFLDSCQHLMRGKMNLNALVGKGGNGDWFEQFLETALTQSVNWDEVLKSANRWYDRLVAAAQLKTYREREKALSILDEDLKKLRHQPQGLAMLALLADKTAMTKFFGDTLISLLLPAVMQCHRAENRITQRFQNLEIAMALSEWRGDHESYPASLAALAPKYLAVAPTDMFTEQPLQYVKKADGYQFYSVGENLKDDKGKTFGEQPGGDDLVVTMPYPFTR